MAVQTVLNIISRALRLIGVAQTGEAVGSEEASDALVALNQLTSEWNNESLMLFGFMNELFPLTATTGVYTIGPGGDIDTARPQSITRAFVRYNASASPSFQYDYQLEIVPNEKYQEVFLKQLSVTYPIYLFYDNKYPLGTITLYPYPSQACTLGLSSWNQISQFTNLIQDIEMPPGYESALAYGLAVAIAPEYGKSIDPIILNKANETKSAIMRTNHQIRYMKTDTMLLPKRTFNILTGSYQ
jgi:hypothetical protein